MSDFDGLIKVAVAIEGVGREIVESLDKIAVQLDAMTRKLERLADKE